MAPHDKDDDEATRFPSLVCTSDDSHLDPSYKKLFIRLRIDPKPDFFINNIMFPFLMIVSCSFSIFSIDFESVNERLSVSVIILLTCTPFQTLIADQMPHRSRMMLIDYYIGLAFLIQVLLVLSTSLVSALTQLDVDTDTVYLIDSTLGATLGVIWILSSAIYLSLSSKACRNLYGEYLSFNDWELRDRGNKEWYRGNTSVGYVRSTERKSFEFTFLIFLFRLSISPSSP